MDNWCPPHTISRSPWRSEIAVPFCSLFQAYQNCPCPDWQYRVHVSSSPLSPRCWPAVYSPPVPLGLPPASVSSTVSSAGAAFWQWNGALAAPHSWNGCRKKFDTDQPENGQFPVHRTRSMVIPRGLKVKCYLDLVKFNCHQCSTLIGWPIARLWVIPYQRPKVRAWPYFHFEDEESCSLPKLVSSIFHRLVGFY